MPFGSWQCLYLSILNNAGNVSENHLQRKQEAVTAVFTFLFLIIFKFGQSQGRCSSFVPGLVISNVEILLQLYGHSQTEV